MADRIAVGVIRKAHGVRGEASVEPWTGSLDRFSELDDVTLVSPDESESRETRIESVRPHAGRILLKFECIHSPEDVKRLQNWTVEIPETEARVPGEGEYFLHDLAGLTLFDEDGRERGRVIDVYEGGGGLLLLVARSDGKEFELPFAAELCREIDITRRKMIVHLPAGLDDLDTIPD